MSNLFVIGFNDVGAAEQARERIIGLQKQQLIELDDIVVVENRDGKVKLRQIRNTTAAGATGGALWGGLIGLLFFMPLLGMAVGAGAGALGGSATDLGVDDNFMRELGQKLEPGKAAVFALVRKATKDKVLEEVADMGGWIIQTSLSADDEKELIAALEGAAR
ncbi:DUF1269 domain-containing protein [Glycomyces albus]